MATSQKEQNAIQMKLELTDEDTAIENMINSFKQLSVQDVEQQIFLINLSGYILQVGRVKGSQIKLLLEEVFKVVFKKGVEITLPDWYDDNDDDLNDSSYSDEFDNLMDPAKLTTPPAQIPKETSEDAEFLNNENDPNVHMAKSVDSDYTPPNE